MTTCSLYVCVYVVAVVEAALPMVVGGNKGMDMGLEKLGLALGMGKERGMGRVRVSFFFN